MTGKLEDLGWPEASLFDFSYEGDALGFRMYDLLSYEGLMFEIVEVSISAIEALHIELRPFADGRYGPEIIAVSFGAPTDADEVFEGITRENPFTDARAEYFWLSSTLRAGRIEIVRTGRIESLSRRG